MDDDADQEVASCRRWYAEEIRWAAGCPAEQIVEAFAQVPRELFLGPGPWRVLAGAAYQDTPDDDPQHVYHNTLIALDESKRLNNGMPAPWAFWLNAVSPRLGDQVLHVGAGTGYYTAILAELVGQSGSVLAFELEASLAARAEQALVGWPNAHVVAGDAVGTSLDGNELDLIVVSAGVAGIPAAWPTSLKPAGRLILPLATRSKHDVIQAGRMLRVQRQAEGYSAGFVSGASFYPCVGTQGAGADDALAAALKRGDSDSVRSLRLDDHQVGGDCWLHRDGVCLSRRGL